MKDVEAPGLFSPQRAIEHAVSEPGVRPLRYFRALWPLWQVEIAGAVDDPQAYEVLDRFITRAISEARLNTPESIGDFFGLTVPLVRECLRHLTMIEHVTERSGAFSLTDRGERSLRAGKRYVAKETRQHLLFDRFTGGALPRSHYDSSVAVVDRGWLERTRSTDRAPFTPLFAATHYSDDLVSELIVDPRRAEHNLPDQVTDIRVLGVTDVYLPLYLVQATDRLLAYTRAGETRDVFIEELCRRIPAIGLGLAAESAVDQHSLWTEWVAGLSVPPKSLRQLPNGVWRCIMPASAFIGNGGLPTRRIGSFDVRRNHFIQIWCDDPALRNQALFERAARMTGSRQMRTRAALLEQLAEVAARLDLPAPDIAALRNHARAADLPDVLDRLDRLG